MCKSLYYDVTIAHIMPMCITPLSTYEEEACMMSLVSAFCWWHVSVLQLFVIPAIAQLFALDTMPHLQMQPFKGVQ